jgi:hypothetical protein
MDDCEYVSVSHLYEAAKIGFALQNLACMLRVYHKGHVPTTLSKPHVTYSLAEEEEEEKKAVQRSLRSPDCVKCIHL